MRINADGFKYEQTSTYVPADVTFTGDEQDVEGAGVELTISPNIIEQKKSTSQEVANRYNVGNHIEGQAVMTAASLELLALMLHESVDTKTITLNATKSQPAALDDYAITFQVDLPDDATNDTETYIITGLHFVGDLSAAYQADEAWYLPLKVQSTSNTQMQIQQA